MAENELNYLDDFLDLYDFIPNEDLKTLLAVYHSDMQGAILYSQQGLSTSGHRYMAMDTT